MTSYNIFNQKPFALVYPINTSGCKNVLFIDNSIKEPQLFMSSVNASTFPIIYSITSTKTDLLALLKTTFTSIERIGIVFTSQLGCVKKFLDIKAFSDSENIDFLVSIIKEFNVKNIDYLGCDTLSDSNWVNYYNTLTDVTIGASNDKTGNIKYGGDWIMESTSQDIELVYFTKNIEYYTYLLDDIPNWVTGLDSPQFVVISGQYMYVGNGGNQIAKIDIPTASIITLTWVIGGTLSNVYGLVINGQYMYVANGNNISQINLEDGSIVNTTWATGLLNQPTGLVIDGQYMYVSNYGNGTISQINLEDGSIEKADWATGLSSPAGLVINGQYMYVSNYGNGTISQINLEDGSIKKADWATGLILPVELVINGQYMYVTNSGFTTNTISQILLEDGSTVNETWAIGLSIPIGLVIDGRNMYVSNLGTGIISRFDLPEPPCLLACSSVLLADYTYKHISQVTTNDYVLCPFSKQPKKIKRCRCNTVDLKNLNVNNFPYRIPKWFFTPTIPEKDVFISGYHRIITPSLTNIFDWIQTHRIVPDEYKITNEEEILEITGESEVRYYHIELEGGKGGMFVDGLPVETLGENE